MLFLIVREHLHMGGYFTVGLQRGQEETEGGV